jgi:hypothetical protein
MLRHGGVGLSRSVEFPNKRDTLPGGVLDSKGMHIPILDLGAPDEPPKGKKSFLLGTYGCLIGTFRYRYSFGEPEQLELEDFNSRIIELSRDERRMPRNKKAIEAAQNFYDVMGAEMFPDAMAAYSKTVNVKNWIDAPKRYS